MPIRCGAVPEHFFYPWKKWLEKGGGEKAGWIWEEFPGGSGAMLQAMEEGKLDAAFLLTESALMASSKAADIEILFPYVVSPLLWGIFTGSQNPVRNVSEGKSYAISRFSSGSHLMAILEAEGRKVKISGEQWKLADNLEGARKMLTNLEADLFFWEKWTTKPLVDSGEFRMLDVFPGPWPAFVFCVSRRWLKETTSFDQVKNDFDEVCQVAQTIKKNLKESFVEISRIYGISEGDVQAWLQHVEWANSSAFETKFLVDAKNQMIQAGIISQGTPYQEPSSRKEI